MTSITHPSDVAAEAPAAPEAPEARGASETSEATIERYTSSMLSVFGRPRRTLVRGEGSYVWDADGVRYLDLLGGIAVNALGHAHPRLAAAVAEQAATLIHTSNFFTTPGQVRLAERLLAVAGAPEGSAVFFANSGSEALEAAIKLSRRTGRSGIVAAERAFHGRTCGAVSLTHKPAYREPFFPLLPGVEHVPFGDVEALRAILAARGGDIAAVFLEPVQGEAGVVPAPPGYLAAAREITREHGALLVLDEVQTGVGRTGWWFAFQESGIVPDAITVAKGLGGGFPIGALVTFGPECSGLLTAGQHGTTFGGNPLACAAGNAVLDVIEDDDVLAHVRDVSAWLADALAAAADPRVRQVRCAGLLVGIELTGEFAARAADLALEAGFVVNPVRPDTLRLAPGLLVTREELTPFVEALPGLLARAEAG